MSKKLDKKITGAAPVPTPLVHLEYEDAAARRVGIAGTFNDWHPETSEMISMGRASG